MSMSALTEAVSPDATLRERLRVLLFARVLVVTVFLAAVGAYHLTVAHSEGVIGSATFLAIAAAYALTLVSALAVSRVHVGGLRLFAYAQMVFDVLLLTGAIELARGVGSPLAVLYVLAVANAAGLLLMRGALVSAVAASLAYVYLTVQTAAVVGTRGFLLEVFVPSLLGTSCLVLAAVLIGSLARRLAATEAELTLRDHEVSRLEGLQRALANGLESGLLVADVSGRVRSANPACQQILGQPASSILGREIHWLVPLLATADDDAPPSDDGYRECEYRAPDGSSSRLRVKRTPLFDTFANRIGEIVLLQDVTRIQELEERLARDEQGLTIDAAPPTEGDGAEPAEPTDDERDGIVSGCAGMRAVSKLIDKVAHADATVLVTGESGTGKELVARAVHRRSARASAPFVVVNCGAIPENLIESELFGHVRGAFTGAVADRPGLFRRAHGGTIFLDEIGELPLQLQVRLLRVLQDRMVMPVGGNAQVAVDVRVITATNRVLEDLVKAGQFREDLYYRLAVIAIHMPPLREREGDLERLIEHFVRTAAARHAKSVARVSGRAMQLLLRYRYPGNVRELENVIEHAVTLADGDAIRESDLPDSVRDAAGPRPPAVGVAAPPPRELRLSDAEAGADGDAAFDDAEEDAVAPPPYVESGLLRELASPLVLPIDEGDGASLDEQLARREKEMLLAALARASGVKKRAATLLGINYRSFRHRLQKYGLDAHGDEMLPRITPTHLHRDPGH